MVVVSRAATLPVLDLGSVNLLEGHSGGSCGPVSASSAFVVFQFPVSACGTTVRVSNLPWEQRLLHSVACLYKLPFPPFCIQVEGDYVVYANRMSSTYEVGVGPLGSITRDSVYA